MKKKGFTLIELLVVIAIIGLLSTLAVVSLGSARAKARDAKKVSDVKAIQTAMEMYKSDNNDTATNVTSTLAGYIQGGFPTGNTYTVCASSTFYVIGVGLEASTSVSGSYVGTLPGWSTAACGGATLPTCNTGKGFCVGSVQ